jgi:DNA-directed RNA polymerase subunit beta'
MIINAVDCGTRAGLWVRSSDNAEDPNLPQLGERILGRVLAGPILDPASGEVLYERGTLMDEAAVARVEAAGVEEVFIRSPLTCQLGQGLCQQCYGRDLGRGELVELGAAVGIVAAQSIGEPGTQLTLRTFHTGGIAHGGDITHGLPRVEELLEARKHPKGESMLSDIGGRVEVDQLEDGTRLVRVIDTRLIRDEYAQETGWKVMLEEGQEEIQEDDVIAIRADAEAEGDGPTGRDASVARTAPGELFDLAMDVGVIEQSGSWYKYDDETLAQGGDNTKDLLSESPGLRREIENAVREETGMQVLPSIDVQRAKTSGRVIRENGEIVVVHEEREEREYEIAASARLLVSEGQRIKAGEQLTEGTKNAHTLLQVLGREAAQRYMLTEVQKVYRSQGVNIHDKHFEVILSKMLSMVQVLRSGDTELLPGDLMERGKFAEINERAVSEGGDPASAKPVLLGVTKAALNTESFLSAASFQYTIKVLSAAAIEGKRDELKGLKENVIIGKRIPAGTGFWEAHKDLLPATTSEEEDLLKEILAEELGSGEEDVSQILDEELGSEGESAEALFTELSAEEAADLEGLGAPPEDLTIESIARLLGIEGSDEEEEQQEDEEDAGPSPDTDLREPGDSEEESG